MTSTGFERRSRLEIIASILGACRYSRRKYHVMYACNMSSPQFTGYLDMLLKANLLLTEIDRGHLWLRVSDKGKGLSEGIQQREDYTGISACATEPNNMF